MKASTFKYSRSEAEASLQRATGKQKHEPRRDETVEGDGKREDSGVGLIRMPFEPNPDQISLLPKVLHTVTLPYLSECIRPCCCPLS